VAIRYQVITKAALTGFPRRANTHDQSGAADAARSDQRIEVDGK